MNWRQSMLQIVLVFVAGAMLFDLSRQPRSQVTGPNFARLEPGMTMNDAVALLGEPDLKNEPTPGMHWWTWYDPRSLDNSVSGIFVTPPGTLREKEQLGVLPNRPRLMPKTRVKPPVPPFVQQTLAMSQDRERGMTLMTAPRSKTIDPLFLP